jgi:hypothetical protein
MSKESCHLWYLKNAEHQKKKQRERTQFNIRNRKCLDCAKPLEIKEHRRCAKCKSHRNDYRKNRVKNGLCWWCGEKIDIPNFTMCSKCRIKNNNDRNNRIRGNKAVAVSMLGGKCSMCGFQTNVLSVYDFHHLDPSKKEVNKQERIVAFSGEKMMAELKKCILVCSNCHRIIHARDEGI